MLQNSCTWKDIKIFILNKEMTRPTVTVYSLLSTQFFTQHLVLVTFPKGLYQNLVRERYGFKSKQCFVSNRFDLFLVIIYFEISDRMKRRTLFFFLLSKEGMSLKKSKKCFLVCNLGVFCCLFCSFVCFLKFESNTFLGNIFQMTSSRESMSQNTHKSTLNHLVLE